MMTAMSAIVAELEGLFGLGWARPAGAWAFALPVALWLLSRWRARPPSIATGTLALWKEVAGPDPRRAARRRPGTPPATRWTVAALVLGALALSGPRQRGAELPRVWTLVVDHRPSTALPVRARADGEPRLRVALALALEWLEERLGPRDRVRWISPVRAEVELPPAERPAEPWLAHPAWFAAPPRWALADEPGTLWVTDVAPELAPLQAGLFASGAEPIPGAIAALGTTRLDWDGERVVRFENGLEPRALELRAGTAPLPAALRALATLWARERGLLVSDEPHPRTALVLAAAGDTQREVAVRAGRDGWSFEGRAAAGGIAPLASPAPQELWLAGRLADGRTIDLVRTEPGRVRVAWRELDEETGDPAALAVSWSRLFEAWALPPPGVVPLAERERSGAAVTRAPQPAPPVWTVGGEKRRGQGLDAWLASGAALLGAVALSTAVVGRSRRA